MRKHERVPRSANWCQLIKMDPLWWLLRICSQGNAELVLSTAIISWETFPFTLLGTPNKIPPIIDSGVWKVGRDSISSKKTAEEITDLKKEVIIQLTGAACIIWVIFLSLKDGFHEREHVSEREATQACSCTKRFIQWVVIIVAFPLEDRFNPSLLYRN